MSITVKVEGLNELEAALAEWEQLSGKSGKPILRRALVKAAKPMQAIAKAHSPWPDIADEANIKVATSYIDGDGKRRKSKEPATSVYAYLYDPKSTASIFEFGTVDRFQDSTGKYTGQIEPHRYLYRAAHAGFDEFVSSVSDQVGMKLKKAFEKHVKKNGG